MEHLNKVELRGIVGNVATQEYCCDRVAKISLCTTEFHKDKQGAVFCCTDWHQVTAWQSNIEGFDLASITKGDRLHVLGRLRIQRYEDEEGRVRQVTDILANKVERVSDDTDSDI